MIYDVKKIGISANDGQIIIENSDGKFSKTIEIWFDANCPFCRRHWLDNLDNYMKEVSDGKLKLTMIPVAFLTEYSMQIGGLLLGTANFGSKLFLDVFKSAIFQGIGEEVGNDENTVNEKLKNLSENVILPDLEEEDISIKKYKANIGEDNFKKIQENNAKAEEKGIEGVPYILEK